jgi:hypothetical protein
MILGKSRQNSVLHAPSVAAKSKKVNQSFTGHHPEKLFASHAANRLTNNLNFLYRTKKSTTDLIQKVVIKQEGLRPFFGRYQTRS